MTGFVAVLHYIVLMIVLVLSYALYRVPFALTGKKHPNHWTRGNTVDDPAVLVRAQHAHANAVENFPLFLGVVVIGALMGKSEAVIDPLAMYVVFARVAQATVHIIGTSFWLVLARATFFLTQIVLIGIMVWGLLPH